LTLAIELNIIGTIQRKNQSLIPKSSLFIVLKTRRSQIPGLVLVALNNLVEIALGVARKEGIMYRI